LQKHVDSLSSSIDRLQNYIDSLQQVTDSLLSIPAANVTDYRAGLVFWKGWGGDGGTLSAPLFPFRFWGDLYGEVIFLYSRRQIQTRNLLNQYVRSENKYADLICSLSPKLGFVIMDGAGGSVVAYSALRAIVDTRGDWWNNVGSVSAGLRYKPIRSLDFVMTGEYVLGSYFGRHYGDDVNPNKPTFSNLKIGVNFWYGLGL
jgi:hypothetical protein